MLGVAKRVLDSWLFKVAWGVIVALWAVQFAAKVQSSWLDWFNCTILLLYVGVKILDLNIVRMLAYRRMWPHLSWFSAFVYLPWTLLTATIGRAFGVKHDTEAWANQQMRFVAMQTPDPGARASRLVFLIDLGTFMAPGPKALETAKMLGAIADEKFEYAAGWHGDVHSIAPEEGA
jgi:hypothetical protein